MHGHYSLRLIVPHQAIGDMIAFPSLKTCELQLQDWNRRPQSKIEPGSHNEIKRPKFLSIISFIPSVVPVG